MTSIPAEMGNGDQPERVGQPVSGALWPLNHADTVLRRDVRLIAEALQFGRIVQPVEIEVIQLQRCPLMLTNERKRRALYRLRNAHSSSNALCQRGLPGAKIAMQQDDIAGAQLLAKSSPILVHGGRR
jgi:hypothetical protein